MLKHRYRVDAHDLIDLDRFFHSWPKTITNMEWLYELTYYKFVVQHGIVDSEL